MFKEPTVFVLGAGAGVDIGMPTGAALIEQLISKLDFNFQHGELKQGDDEIANALRIAAARKQISMNELMRASHAIAQGVSYVRSIDSYIHTHRHDEAIKICGKIGIVQTIVAYERASRLFVEETSGNKKFVDAATVRKSWLSELMYLLSAGVGAKDDLEDIFDNVTFINFNYDRCIEHYLYRALQELFLIESERAAGLMKKAVVFHPYGRVAHLPWQNEGGVHYGGDAYGHPIDLELLSNNIRTFNEEVENNAPLAALRKRLVGAERVVFLGFHFHRQNMELLRHPSPNKVNKGISVYVSTYGRSATDQREISKGIDELFGDARSEVSPHLLGLDCKALFVEFASSWT